MTEEHKELQEEYIEVADLKMLKQKLIDNYNYVSMLDIVLNIIKKLDESNWAKSLTTEETLKLKKLHETFGRGDITEIYEELIENIIRVMIGYHTSKILI